MKKRRYIILSIIISFVILVCLGVVVAGTYIGSNIDYTIDEELFRSARSGNSTVYLAYVDGEMKEVWQDDFGARKQWCGIDEVGEYLKDGFISMEDRDFYKHNGVNLRRSAVALLNYLVKYKDSFGASTITQQVIKNISGDNQQTAKRKIAEMFRASNLEKHFTKDEIFEVYLNIVPMSGNMYGVRAASRTYFGVEPSELSLAEAATIVGITNSPGRYNPYKNPEACTKKRNKVLYAMLDNGVITKEEYNEAVKSPLELADALYDESYSSWFIETARGDVIKDLKKKYKVGNAAAELMLRGCSVVLTMDSEVQEILEDYFENEANLPEEYARGLNYSMTVIDNSNGNLVGIIGGGGKKEGELLYNNATANVIPGSVLKPIALYAPLLEEGKINWATVFDDAPLYYNESENGIIPYPKNASLEYDGLTTVKDALMWSKNTVAAHLYNKLGGRKVYRHLSEKYGFRLVEKERNSDGKILTDIDMAPLALGQLTKGVSIRSLTEAYSAFPREGAHSYSRSYYGVFSDTGAVLLENKGKNTRIYEPKTARIMNKLLETVVSSGTASNIRLKEIVDVAGKTGTSGGDLDRLFIGYTPYYTAGIWCGYSGEKKAIGRLSPSHLNIWDNVMTNIHRAKLAREYDEELLSFSVEGLEYLPYCRDSGNEYGECCDHDLRGSRIEYGYFSEDNKPSGKCSTHQLFRYDPISGSVYDYEKEERGDFLISLLIIERNLPEGITVKDEEYVIRTKKETKQPRDESREQPIKALPESERKGSQNRRKRRGELR